MALARLGVAKIMIMDRDVVETTNLNRQVLFSRADVGRKKVDAAFDSLSFHTCGDTVVEKYHIDVLIEWPLIVQKAREEATVLFQCVDVGRYFDYAVLGLCRTLGLPFVSGSSYSSTVIVEFFTGKPQHSSFSFATADLDPHILAQLHEHKAHTLPDLKFVPYDVKPDTRAVGSSCLVATTCGLLMVNAWVQARMASQTQPRPSANHTSCPSNASSGAQTTQAGTATTGENKSKINENKIQVHGPTNPEAAEQEQQHDPEHGLEKVNGRESNEIPPDPVPNWMKLEMHQYWYVDR